MENQLSSRHSRLQLCLEKWVSWVCTLLCNTYLPGTNTSASVIADENKSELFVLEITLVKKMFASDPGIQFYVVFTHLFRSISNLLSIFGYHFSKSIEECKFYSQFFSEATSQSRGKEILWNFLMNRKYLNHGLTPIRRVKKILYLERDFI